MQHDFDAVGNVVYGPTGSSAPSPYPSSSPLATNVGFRDPDTKLYSAADNGLSWAYSPEIGDDADKGVDEAGRDLVHRGYNGGVHALSGYGMEVLNTAASFHPLYNLHTVATGRGASDRCVSTWERVVSGFSLVPGAAWERLGVGLGNTVAKVGRSAGGLWGKSEGVFKSAIAFGKHSIMNPD